MSSVRKAVIPAAGLGTRFLPASKAMPKEMLAVVDKPAIQYVVEEAVRAGIDDILIITGRGKNSIEDHFDRAIELEVALEASGKLDQLETVRSLAELADIHYIRQGEALGLGHAVSMARKHVGDDSFAVLLGDDMMVDSSTVLQGMIAAHEQHQASVIAVKRFPPEEISAYGCIDPCRPEDDADTGQSVAQSPQRGRAGPTGEGTIDNLVPFKSIVEKPAPADAPSDLAVLGRYVFTPQIFDAIAHTKPGVGDEIQLTDAIGELLATQRVYGYVFETGRYDIGKKLDYLRATVEVALDRDDLGPEFGPMLAEIVRRRGLR